MNNHINMSRKLEHKIDVLEDEKQYFKRNWKNKIDVYEKRINKLNEGISHIENLLKLDTEIKDVITDLLIILSDNKAPLNIQQQKIIKEKRKKTTLYSVTVDICDYVNEEAKKTKTARRKIRNLDRFTYQGIEYRIIYKNLKLIVKATEQDAQLFKNKIISKQHELYTKLHNIFMTWEAYRKNMIS